MKSKCSFILKSSLSLVLALLLLFGTMSTGIAAVVESAGTSAKADVAGTGANADLAETGASRTAYYISGGSGIRGSNWPAPTAMTVSTGGYYCYYRASGITLNQNSSNNEFLVYDDSSWNGKHDNYSASSFWGSGNWTGGFWKEGSNLALWSSGTTQPYIVTYYPNTELNNNNYPLTCIYDSLPNDTATYYLRHNFTDGTNFEVVSLGTTSKTNWDTKTYTATVTMKAASTNYEYKIYKSFGSSYTSKADNWYGNSGTMTSSNSSSWNCDTNVNTGGNIGITSSTAPDVTYTFNVTDSNWHDNASYERVTVSVVYPTVRTVTVNQYKGASGTTGKAGTVKINTTSVITNGGSAKIANGTAYTTKVTAPTGYTILSVTAGSNTTWSRDAGDTGTEVYNGKVTASGGNGSLTVRYSPKTSTVTLNKNKDSAVAGTASVTATYDDNMPTESVTMPTCTGYEFQGYYDISAASGGNQYYTKAGASSRTWDKTGNQTLYARWSIYKSNLTFDYTTNGGSNTGRPTGKQATYGSAMPSITAGQLPANRTGYTFTGIWDAPTGGTKYYNTDASSAHAWDKETMSGTTLYAQWEEITAGIALTAYTDGTPSTAGGHIEDGSGNTITSLSGVGISTKGTAVSVVTGGGQYAFSGWATDGTNASHINIYTDSSCETLYTGSENPQPTTVYIKTDGTDGMTTADSIVRANFVLANRTVTVGRMLDTDGTGYSSARATSDGISPAMSGEGTYSVSSADAFTVSTSDVSGYKFMGWMISDSAQTSADADYTPDDTDLSNNYTMSASIGTYYYALYRKEYYVTVYSSYVDDLSSAGFHKVAAPPKKVTTTTPEGVTTTYTYVYNNESAGEDATVSSTGNFNEGNKLKIVAGDTVKLYYTALSSSEAIKGVFFNNDIRYTTEDQEDNWYKDASHDGHPFAEGTGDDDWDYTYESDTTLFADPNYYTSEDFVNNGTYTGQLVTTAIAAQSSGYKATVSNDTHIVQWTATQNYRNVDLELGTLYRIYFSNPEKIEITSEKVDNYYDVGATITSALKVNAKASSTATHTITRSSITFWEADASGNKTNTQITNTDIIDKAGATSSTNSSNKITFSGTMPACNIYVDLNVATTYMVGVGSKCMASPNEGFTDLTNAGSISSSHLGSITTSPSVANSNVTNATSVSDGTQVTFTFTWYNTWGSYYMFLGWYESARDATAPDFTKPRLSTELSFAYTPKKNVRIWAVATRTFYVGGDFTQNSTTKEITYTTTGSNNLSYYNHIEMDYDAANERYVFEFPNIPTSNTQKVYMRVYDTASGYDNTTFWDQVDTAEKGKGGDDDNWNYGWGPTTIDSDTNGVVWGLQPGWRNNLAGEEDEYNRNLDGKGYWYVDSDLRGKGWGGPVKFYFYPRKDSGTGWSVHSSYQWTNCYISGGYASVDGSSAYPTISAGAGSTITGPIGGGWSPTNETVRHYRITTKNGGITIAKTVSSGYKVSAFVVYDINSKKAKSVKGAEITYSNSDLTATATITPSGDCYICPVIDKDTANATVYVNTSDLNMSKWGGLVSMYTWAGAEGSETNLNYGAFPGQLMIPSDDGKSWYANVDASVMDGILFSNYYQNTWVTTATTIVDSGGTAVPTGYNTDQRIRQTFDYREPEALYANQSNALGVNRMMYFAIKDGNTKTSNVAYATLASNRTLSNYDWEYLTNFDGTKYIDLNGTEIETQPTATYYIIAQGDAYYENSGFYPSTTVNTKGGTKQYTYPKVNTYNGKRSVQWYVYDSDGRYLFNTLSAAFADEQDGLTYIASLLEARGEPYVGKSVKICYDTPLDYGNGQVIRYSGQWYKQDIIKKVTAKVEMGVFSNDIYTPQGVPQVSGLGTALVKYTGGNLAAATSGSTSLTATVEGSSQSGYDSYKIPLYDAALAPLTLYATEQNFLGWYVYDKDLDDYIQVSTDPSCEINFSGDVTYYAMYQARAIYKYQYQGRRGTVEYTVASPTDMTSAEIANSQTPNSTNRAAEIALMAPQVSDVSVFTQDLTFTFGSVSKTAAFTLTITGTSKSSTSYTLTVKEPDNETTLATLSGGYNTVHALTYAQYSVLNTYASANNKYFVGWYDDPTDGKLLSIQHNFGMSITQNTTIYPRFADTERTTITGFEPYIDRNNISKELTSGESGTFYNDSIVRFQGERGATAAPSDCGLLVIYQNDTSTPMSSPTGPNLTTIATSLRAEGNEGKTAKLTSLNAKAFNITCSSLNNLNRADIVFVSDYASFNGKAYEVYSYYFDGTSYHFSAVTSGTYA